MKVSFLVKLTLVLHDAEYYYRIQIEGKEIEKLYPSRTYIGLGVSFMIQDAIKQNGLHTMYSPKAKLSDILNLDTFTTIVLMQHKTQEHYEADSIAKQQALSVPFI